jgi:hypothetical protein
MWAKVPLALFVIVIAFDGAVLRWRLAVALLEWSSRGGLRALMRRPMIHWVWIAATIVAFALLQALYIRQHWTGASNPGAVSALIHALLILISGLAVWPNARWLSAYATQRTFVAPAPAPEAAKGAGLTRDRGDRGRGG